MLKTIFFYFVSTGLFNVCAYSINEVLVLISRGNLVDKYRTMLIKSSWMLSISLLGLVIHRISREKELLLTWAVDKLCIGHFYFFAKVTYFLFCAFIITNFFFNALNSMDNSTMIASTEVKSYCLQ